MTNRVGNFLLRPNGPSRSGPHILERTRASHHQAMAARGVLMDPIKLCNVLGGEGSDGIIHLDRMAALNYNTIPELTLGRVAGTLASELWDPPKCNFPVILQVLPVPEGLIMNLLVRTDKSEVDVADRLSDQLLAVIDGGPERLEQQTAS